MNRLGTSERTYHARRAIMLDILRRASGLDDVEAERLVSAWERQAEKQELDRFMPAFWTAGERWIWNESRGRQARNPEPPWDKEPPATE